MKLDMPLTKPNQNDSDILISSFWININFIVLGGLLEGTISLTMFNTKVFLV